MDKTNLEVNISAVDNFSQVFDKLNAKLGEVNKKKANIATGDIKDIDRLIHDLGRAFGDLSNDKFIKSSSVKRLTDELNNAVKIATDLQKKLDSLSYTNKKTKGNTLSGMYNADDYKYVKKLLKSREKDFKVEIKPDMSKTSANIKQAQKDIQKNLKDNTVKQKVEVKPVVNQKDLSKDKGTKAKVEVSADVTQASSTIKNLRENVEKTPIRQKVVVDKPDSASAKQDNAIKTNIDDRNLSKSISDSVDKINSKPYNIKIGKDEKYFNKVIDDNIKDVNKKNISLKAILDKESLSRIKEDLQKVKISLPLKLDGKGIKASLREISESLPTIKLTGSVSKNSIQTALNAMKDLKINVDANVRTKQLKNNVTETNKNTSTDSNNAVKKAFDDKEVSVKVNQDRFSKSLSSIKDKLNAFLRDNYKISVVVNQEKLQKSLDSANKKIDSVKKERVLDINTSNITYKLMQLATYINQFNTKEIKPRVDTGIENVVKLSTYLNQLKSKNMSITIDIVGDKAKTVITDTKKLLTDLVKQKYKIGFDTTDLTGKGSQLKTTANTLKHMADSLKQIKSRNITLNISSGKVGNAVKTLRSLNRELQNIKHNIIVNIKVNANDSLQVLKDINSELRQLKKNSNVTIKVNNGGNSRGGSIRPTRTSGGLSGGSIGSNTYGSFLGNFMNGVLQFVGRSSKGWGSFGEAIARVNQNMMSLGGSVGKVGVALSVVTATASILSAGMYMTINALQTFGSILISIGQTIYNALKPGIELYKQQQSALFSFTAALQSNGSVDGTRLQDMGSEGRSIARGVSKELIQRATLDAEMSAFSLEDLLTSLQGTLPMLMQRGMSAAQAYEVNKGVAGVAKMIQLKPSQILQETRDLAQGSITSRGSQIANALGITNEDLAKYQGNADALFNYLMQKFQNYGEMLQEFEDTAVGRYQQLEERWQTVTRNIVEGLAPQFKGLFETLIEMTGQWVDRTGNHLNALTGKWEDAKGNIYNKDSKQWEDSSGNAIAFADEELSQKGYKFNEELQLWQDNIGRVMGSVEDLGHSLHETVGGGADFQLSDLLEEAKQALIEIIEYIAQTVDGLEEWLQKELGIVDPIQEAKDLIKTIIDLFSTTVMIVGKVLALLMENQDVIFAIVKTTVRFLLILMEIPTGLNVIIGAFKYLFKLLVSIVEETSLWAKMLGQILTGDFDGAKNTFQEINNRTNNGIANATKEFIGDMKASAGITGALFGDWNNVNSVDDLLKLVGVGTKNGKWSSAVRKYFGKTVDGSDKGDSKGKTLEDVRGNNDLEKANKQAIKDAQKMLKEQISRLKEILADALDELKQRLEESEIAYKEGFISMKQYYETKAQIEREEARLRLEEAQQEYALIQNTTFENEYDKLKALHDTNRAIRKYTRAVERTERQFYEVSKNFREGSDNISRTIARATQITNNTYNVPSSQHSKQSYKQIAINTELSEAVVSAIVDGVRAYNFAKDANGNDLHRYKLDPAIVLAQAIQESGGNQGVISPAGAIGVMQLMPGTASSLGVNPYDISQNIKGGIQYFGQQLEEFNGSVEKALAAYNAGPGSIYEYGGIPPYSETQSYVKNILSNAENIRSSLQSVESSVETNSNSLYSSSVSLEGYGDTWIAESDRIYEQMQNLNDNAKFMWNNIVAWWREHHPDSQLIAFSGNRATDPNTTAEVGEHDGNAIDFGDSGGLLVDIANFNELKDFIQNVLGAGLADEYRNTTYGGNHAHVNATGWNWTDGIQMRGVNREELLSKGYYHPEVDKTKGGYEVFDKEKQLDMKIKKFYADNESRTLYGLQKQLDVIDAECEEEVKNVINEMKDNHTESEISAVVAEIRKKYERQTRELRETVANNMLEYSVGAFEDWATVKGFSIYQNGGQSIQNAISKYYADFYENENNPLSPAYAIKHLRILYEQAQNSGDLLKAQSIRRKIVETYSALDNMVKSWLDRYISYFDNYQTWLNNNPRATTLQKEMGDREIQARRYEGESNFRGIVIERNQEQIDALSKSIDEAEKANEVIRERLKYYKELGEESEEYKNNIEEIQRIENDASRNQSLIDVNTQIKNRLEMEQQEQIALKAIADELKKQPNLWDDVRQAALQALEDGIVEFLTDGILEAESLGEALRNLATGILKEIQQVFAKRIALDITNGINSLLDKDGNDNFAKATGYEQMIASNRDLFYKLYQNNNENATRIVDAMRNGAGLTDGTLEESNALREQEISSQQTAIGVAERDISVSTVTNAQIAQNNTLTNQNNAEVSQNNALTNQNTSEVTRNISALTQNTATMEQSAEIANENISTDNQAIEAINRNTDAVERNTNEANQNNSASNMSGMSSATGGYFGTPHTGATGYGNNFISNFMNSKIFGEILDFANGIFGSALGQLAGLGNAVDAIINGDTKERLLGTIFIELELIYQQLVAIGQTISGVYGLATGGIVKLATGGAVYHNNGIISGPGTSTSDSIPAMLSNGEAVINAKAVKELGTGFIHAVNNGEFSKIRAKIPQLSDGGTIGEAQQGTARGITDFAKSVGTSVTTTNQMNIALVRDEREAMEHFMRSPQGQRIMVDFQRGNGRVMSRFNG